MSFLPLSFPLVHGSFFTLFVGALALSVLLGPPRLVTIDLDGRLYSVTTYRRQVADILREARLSYFPEDRISPYSGASLSSDARILLERSLPLTVRADGRQWQRRTLTPTLGEALTEMGISLGPDDLLWLEENPASAETPLRPPRGSSALLTPLVASRGDGQALNPPSLQVRIQRAVPIYLHYGSLTIALPTTEGTTGRLLQQAGLDLYPEDRLYSLETPPSTGQHLYLQRSIPISLTTAAVGTVHLRTLQKTVAAVLQEQGISLGPLDRVTPGPSAPVHFDTAIRVVRVREEIWTQAETVSFQRRLVPDANLELDQQRLVQAGRDGLVKRTFRALFEDGVEVQREVRAMWTEVEVEDRTTAYGTKIVLRDLETPEGTLQYWRTFRVWATSYDASQGGKPKDSPAYGYTAIGLKAERGIIAVDPTVIPLRTQLYVPGYGPAIAGDTGGAIKGRIIDLAFPEGGYWREWGSRYADVYLLAPVPEIGTFPWVLP